MFINNLIFPCSMADILDFPDFDPPLKQVEPDDALIVLAALRTEEQERSELVAVFKPFPTLTSDYLYLPLRRRVRLGIFNRSNSGYLHGQGTGDCIRALDGRKGLQELARTCRWTYQVLTFFDAYTQEQQEGTTRPFTSGTLRQTSDGRTVLKNIRHNGSSLDTVVRIAAEAQPDILNHYWSRQRAEEQREVLIRSPYVY